MTGDSSASASPRRDVAHVAGFGADIPTVCQPRFRPHATVPEDSNEDPRLAGRGCRSNAPLGDARPDTKPSKQKRLIKSPLRPARPAPPPRMVTPVARLPSFGPGWPLGLWASTASADGHSEAGVGGDMIGREKAPYVGRSRDSTSCQVSLLKKQNWGCGLLTGASVRGMRRTGL